MDWAYKAMLTAALVALLLTVSQLFGRRLAGVLAGLPTVTGPALVWLALEHGRHDAVQAAIGSVVGCALCALFALAYERVSRHRGVGAALLAAAVASLLPTPAVELLDGQLLLSVLVAAALVLASAAAMPARPAPRVAVIARGEPWLTAGVAGAVSGAVALAVPQLGPFWAGVLASPPLIAAAVAMRQHAIGGADAAAPFLRGYVSGLLGRIAFIAVFALLLQWLPLPAAAVLAFGFGCGLTWTTERSARLRALTAVWLHRQRIT
jgi:hypothetical protein